MVRPETPTVIHAEARFAHRRDSEVNAPVQLGDAALDRVVDLPLPRESRHIHVEDVESLDGRNTLIRLIDQRLAELSLQELIVVLKTVSPQETPHA